MADNTTLGSMTGGDVIATDDIGGVKYQRVKATYGADGSATDVATAAPLPVQVGDGTNQASVLAGDAGQASQLVAGTRKEVTFSVSTASNTSAVDCSNYRWVSVHVTAAGGSTSFAFQGSNDAVNWDTVLLYRTASITSQPSSGAGGGSGIWHGFVPTRYFRLSFSGSPVSATGVMEFYAQGGAYTSQQAVNASSSPNYIGWATVLGLGDAWSQTNSPPYTTVTSPMLYNGATYDRPRSASAAQGTTGTGVPGAASMYFDGTNYQRVAPGAGLPSAPQVAEYTASLTTANAGSVIIGPVDVRTYTTWSIQVPAGTYTGMQLYVEFSNDQVTWYSPSKYFISTATQDSSGSISSNGLWSGQVNGFRYMRVRLATLTSGGGTTVYFELTSAPQIPNLMYPLSTSGAYQMVFGGGLNSPNDTGLYWQGTGYAVPAAQVAWGGATHVRQRTPTTYKTAAASAAGSTAVWTPSAGKKFRVMRYMISVPANASVAGGSNFDAWLYDGATQLPLVMSVYLPSTSVTTSPGSYSTGWVDLGNGIVSAAANNVLNIFLSDALASGQARVVCCGIEE